MTLITIEHIWREPDGKIGRRDVLINPDWIEAVEVADAYSDLPASTLIFMREVGEKIARRVIRTEMSLAECKAYINSKWKK